MFFCSSSTHYRTVLTGISPTHCRHCRPSYSLPDCTHHRPSLSLPALLRTVLIVVPPTQWPSIQVCDRLELPKDVCAFSFIYPDRDLAMSLKSLQKSKDSDRIILAKQKCARELMFRNDDSDTTEGKLKVSDTSGLASLFTAGGFVYFSPDEDAEEGKLKVCKNAVRAITNRDRDSNCQRSKFCTKPNNHSGQCKTQDLSFERWEVSDI